MVDRLALGEFLSLVFMPDVPVLSGAIIALIFVLVFIFALKLMLQEE